MKLIKTLTLEKVPVGIDHSGHLVFADNPREVGGKPNLQFKSNYIISSYIILWDANREAPPGFGIRVAAKKTYVLRRKIHGKSIMPTVSTLLERVMNFPALEMLAQVELRDAPQALPDRRER